MPAKQKQSPADLLSESKGGAVDVKQATADRRRKWKVDGDYPATDHPQGGKVRVVRSVKTGRPMGEYEPTPGTFQNIEVPTVAALAECIGIGTASE